MPSDGVTAEEIQAQVEAEVAYHTLLTLALWQASRSSRIPTLVITSSNDLTNPPSNQASSLLHAQKHLEAAEASEVHHAGTRTRPWMRPA